MKDVEALANSSSGAVVAGSISVKPRAKNIGQGYWRHKEKFYSLNSYGMPNGGIAYFKEKLPLMVAMAHGQDKPLVANVVGFSTEEFIQLIKLAEDDNADIVELNFGCPNVWEENGEQKLILSYHPDLMKETLSQIKTNNPSIKIAVKLSPLPQRPGSNR